MSFWRIIISIFISSSSRQSGPFLEQVIQKLSDSYPIRRSAQLTAYLFLKGKDKVGTLKEIDSLQQLNKKAIDFKKEVEEEIKKAKDTYRK